MDEAVTQGINRWFATITSQHISTEISSAGSVPMTLHSEETGTSLIIWRSHSIPNLCASVELQ